MHGGKKKMDRSEEYGILVVDDEPSVCRLVVTVLRHDGYAAWSAADGQEAIELFRQQPESVNLLLTDLVMPRKDGFELIREVRAMRPELPVIVMSEHPRRWGTELDGHPRIPKPFAIRMLLDEVRKALQTGTERPLALRAGS
jgi:DNA-binding response OmpR family regulator